MRSATLLATLGLLLTAAGFAQNSRVVVYDFSKGATITEPKIVGGDRITVKIQCVNPISFGYTMKVDEVDFNPISLLSPDLAKVFDRLPTGGLGSLVSGEEIVVNTRDADVLRFKQEAEKLIADAGDLQKAPDQIKTLAEEMRLVPFRTRDLCGGALAKAVAGLRSRLDALDLEKRVLDLEGRYGNLQDRIKIKAQSAAPDVKTDLETITASLVTQLATPLAVFKKTLPQLRDAMAPLQSATQYYEQQIKSVDQEPFVKDLGERASGKRITVTVTSTVNSEAKKALAEDAKKDPTVDQYLKSADVSKSFTFFVESRILTFHAGYAYVRIRDVTFDRIADPRDPTRTLLGKTSDSNARNAAVAFASYPIWQPTCSKCQNIALYGSLGVQMDDPRKTIYAGASVSLRQRFFLSAGLASGERNSLQAGAAEGQPIQPGQEIPVFKNRQLRAFFSITFRPY